MKTALIVSTYNWPEALRISLGNVRIQTILPTFVIVADDGSTEDTRKMIEQMSKDFPVPLHHVWQEDKGFRVARVRNLAMAKAVELGAEYIIQIDGDILMGRHFIEDHISEAQRGVFYCGARAYISPQKTARLLAKGKPAKLSFLSSGIRHRFNALRIPFFTRFTRCKRRYIGCNMAFWLADAKDINGYDEEFVGWGAEDDDFCIRMKRLGCNLQRIKFKAIAFHLAHPDHTRHENHVLLHEKHAQNEYHYCKTGLDGHLSKKD